MNHRLASCSAGKVAVAVAVASLVALTVGFCPGTACAGEPADEAEGRAVDSRSVVGPLAGALTALVPMAVGGALWAHDDRPDLQRDGTYVMLAGFAAAPWVSHAITGRWRRAVGFGLVSLGTTLGTLVSMGVQDPFDPYIANHDRLTFGALLSTAFFAAGLGVADSFIVGPEPAGRP